MGGGMPNELIITLDVCVRVSERAGRNTIMLTHTRTHKAHLYRSAKSLRRQIPQFSTASHQRSSQSGGVAVGVLKSKEKAALILS